MDNRPIGVFDSGVGGLTVLRELKKILPNEELIYIGDTARVPYGTKSKQTVTKFASQIVDFLLHKNVKLIIAACNTVSSNSLNILKKKYPVPIIGVIEPGVRLALSMTKTRRIGVIGTQGTIGSHKYQELIIKKNRSCRIYEKACPLFVPLVEDLLLDTEITYKTISYYLSELKQKKIDTLILGCTHYPLLSKALKRYFGPRVALVNSGYSVSLVARDILRKNQLLTNRKHEGKIILYASDLNINLERLTRTIFHHNYLKIRLINFD